MRVVVSIGGSVLAPELDPARVEAHAGAIERLVAAGCEVGAVVGGGEVAREYIDAARELDASEMLLDRLGIEVTRLNARLLSTAIGDLAGTTPVTEYEAAADAVRSGDVAVMGGVAPGQTTDAVAAALAEAIDADLLIYATSVDGVFDADPERDPDAERYAELTPTELVELVAPMSRGAGASAPVDLLAAKLIERTGRRAIVLDGTEPERIVDAALRGDHTGTDVVVPGDEAPAAWAER